MSSGLAPSLGRRVGAEGVGTALLLATVVGSGVMAERLSAGNTALALLANTLATGAALVALIFAFGPISGAHFNPVVTLADASQGGLRWREVPAYVIAQFAGAVAGVFVAHLMFNEPAFTFSKHARTGAGQFVSEIVATFGLLSVIWGCSSRRQDAVPFAVGAYITAAYWFTASTSFANPAVTVARSLTDSFAGIHPADTPAFIAAQIIGAGAATALFSWLLPRATAKERRSMKTYVFACVHNAGRSQMAAAWLNRLANPEKAHAISAGTQPGTRVHPEVLDAMNEAGVSLARAVPQKLTDDLARDANILITMGCGEACPHIPGLRREDWPLEDPKGKPIERVREIRDEIRGLIEDLIQREGLR
jgi:glycerol uptake facilitator-like aquaporin